jgi:hypothetical protein
MCPFCVKRRGIPDSAMDAIKRSGNKGACHEHFILAGKRRFDPQYCGSGKPEPGIIGRVPDHDHNPVTQLPARPEPFFNKAGSNTLALIFGTYGKRCQSNSRYVGMVGFNRYRDKEDMPDNPVFMHGNEGELVDIIPIIPEGADEPRFTVLAECLEIDLKNGGDICRNFGSDKKRIHPAL